jgi:hypothetical protein
MEFLVTGDAGQLHSCSEFTSPGSWPLLWIFYQERIKKLVDLMDELLVTGKAGQLQRTLQLWVMSSALEFHQERIKNLWILWMSSWWPVRLASCSGLSSSESCHLLWNFIKKELKTCGSYGWALGDQWGWSAAADSPALSHVLCSENFIKKELQTCASYGWAPSDQWGWPAAADSPALSHVPCSGNFIKNCLPTMNFPLQLNYIITSIMILLTDLIISGGFHHTAAGGHASCHAGAALPLQAEYQEWN